MTPEELNRTMDFLLEQQAGFAARQERDHAMMKEMMSRFEVQAAEDRRRIVEIIEIQSLRLDQHDKLIEKLFERPNG